MKTDGGYAFPWKEEDRQGGYVSGNGMTLRDYFAAAALTGILSKGRTDKDKERIAPVAMEAYWWADDMIAARDK